MLPTYKGSKKWVEEHAKTNGTCPNGTVYIGRAYENVQYAKIICYHKKLKLRDVIDQTPDKGNNVFILILRKDFDSIPCKDPHSFLVKAQENPSYQIQPEDMIWIYTNSPAAQLFFCKFVESQTEG